MERALVLEKFRNIGLEKPEKLVLNNSLEKGKMGNLVIVIGANNSGKSNVLDAMTEFAEGRFYPKDVTTLSWSDADRKPAISLVAKDGVDVYSYQMVYGCDKPIISYPRDKAKTLSESKAEIKQFIKTFQSALKENSIGDNYQLNSKLQKLDELNRDSELKFLENQLVENLQSLQREIRYSSSYRAAFNTIVDKCANNSVVLRLYNSTEDPVAILQKKYLARYGINFLPRIYQYQERKISNEDIQTSVDYFAKNEFFKSVFAAIGVDVTEIHNAYKSFNELQNKGILLDLENKLNKKLKSVAKRFNSLYILDDGNYEFKMSLESERIFFAMFRNGSPLTLDFQSTGFRWFFNLYFNLLCSNSLSAGDIVIMDEPATNLHVRGQQELRVFLKDFAVKNDITIVLATHSPFLLDMDYLDELRVVSMHDNVSHIDKDFSTIDLDDPDSLKPVKEALTVNNHVLLDPDAKVVFVEGITDYNYMVAFKKKFNIDNVVFLPIKGVGDYNSPKFKDKQKDISKRLLKIRKNNPILMVDGDGAGKAMKTFNEKNHSELKVFTLSEVKDTFKEIEYLFSADDHKAFGLQTSAGEYVKSSSISAQFKTFGDVNKVSKETEANFKSVFNFIDSL